MDVTSPDSHEVSGSALVRRPSLLIPHGLSLQDSVVSFYDQTNGNGALLLACGSADGCGSPIVIDENDGLKLRDTDELALLLERKCVLPVSFTDPVEGNIQSPVSDNSTAFLEVPVALALPPESSPTGEHLAVNLEGCTARLEIPVEGPVLNESVTLNFDKCSAVLQLPDQSSNVNHDVTMSVADGHQTFLGVPSQVPVSLVSHHSVENHLTAAEMSELSADITNGSCRAEPEPLGLRGMSWYEGNGSDPDTFAACGIRLFSEDQLENLVRERRQERTSDARNRKMSAKALKHLRAALNSETEEDNTESATLRLNTSLNRLVKYTVLKPEDMSAEVVMEYPPPREPKCISWREESLVYDSEYPTISLTSTIVPKAPEMPVRPILKRADRLFPFSEETASPIVLTRKRVKRHHHHRRHWFH